MKPEIKCSVINSIKRLEKIKILAFFKKIRDN
jgi:hypothetical protein